MQRRHRAWPSVLALAAALLLGWGHTAAQSTRPTDLLRAFVAAINAHDVATMRALASSAVILPDTRLPGTTAPTTLDAILNSPEGFLPHITLRNVRQTGPNIAEADLIHTGPRVPRLPHPFVDHGTIVVAHGRIVRIEQRISDQTLAELKTVMAAQPGTLPNTGAAESGWRWGLLALAVACLVGGRRLRQCRS